MGLMYKQITKQILRNKVFVVLLLTLFIMTSLSYFFVRFSIDHNLAALVAMPSLNEQQALYLNALNSNSSLAYIFLASLTGLTSFVLAMFFYNFFRASKKQLGCLKALGFNDNAIMAYFILFIGMLSTIGAVIGLGGGYILSSVLIKANAATYGVAGLVKGVNSGSVLIGLGGTTAVYCVATYLCYYSLRGKETGLLIAGSSGNTYTSILHVANWISNFSPQKPRLHFASPYASPSQYYFLWLQSRPLTCALLSAALSI